MGSKRADTAMALLPPTGWADLVTKDYLDLRLDVLEHRLEAAFERGLKDQLLKIIWAILASQMTLAAIILTAVAMIR